MLSFYMFYDNDSDELVLKTYSTKRKDVKHVNMKMFFPASYIKHMKELVNFVNKYLIRKNKNFNNRIMLDKVYKAKNGSYDKTVFKIFLHKICFLFPDPKSAQLKYIKEDIEDFLNENERKIITKVNENVFKILLLESRHREITKLFIYNFM